MKSLIVTMILLACAATARAEDALPSWNDGPTKKSITDFVAKVKAQGSPDFVKPAERIAVFDNDGTLWCEQPIYFQLAFALDRVRLMAPEHPERRDKEPFKSILAGDMKGFLASGEHGVLAVIATTHSGMTTD